jgi:hypothetical protein
MTEIDMASGQRYRRNVLGKQRYICVFPQKKEVFVSGEALTGNEDLLARLISKLWQAEGAAECLDQLARSSQQSDDLAGVLHSLLLHQ